MIVSLVNLSSEYIKFEIYVGPPAGDVQEAVGINSLESKFRAPVVFDREKKLP